MPAAAVIPAPVTYAKIVAVKMFVIAKNRPSSLVDVSSARVAGQSRYSSSARLPYCAKMKTTAKHGWSMLGGEVKFADPGWTA